MNDRTFYRVLRHFLTLFAFSVVLVGAASAQTTAATATPAAPPAKVDQLLTLLSDPEVKAWLQAKQAAAPSEAGQAETEIAGQMSVWETYIRGRISGMVEAVPRLPAEISNAMRITLDDVNQGHRGRVMSIVLLLIAVGYGAEWLVGRLLRQINHHPSDLASADHQVRLISELIPLIVFTIASAGLFLSFHLPPLLRLFVLTFLSAFIAFRLVRTVSIMLLRPPAQAGAGATARLLDVDDQEAAFWSSRLQVFAAIFLFGWAVVSLMPSLGFSIDVRRIVAYLLGLGLLAVGIEIVWRRPQARQRGRLPAPRAWLATLYLTLLWMVWVGGLNGLLWVGIYVLLLPPVVRGVGKIAAKIAGRGQSGGLGRSLVNVLIVRGARAVVIALAVAWLAYIFNETMTIVGNGAAVERVIDGLLNGIIVLLIADLLWALAKAYIEHRLVLASHGTSPDEMARNGRLRTLLPIFRNALAVFIAAMAVLTVLSGLGVQIMPLIAGAGIFGVAIGFGSQTLVKDVLSGVFYMLDDAFRVGEYIQSGSYKGTVESFSLRSVRLRHHRGPVFTVPFGTLGAVQNMSRDWVMEKMVLNVSYDSDIELARKLIKKIGQELAEDPEFSSSTLQPLKMQGVDSFGETGIVLTMKLMTKPGEQFGIKRKAFVMIKKAFDDNGIKLATPMVQVSGGEDKTSVAAHETVRRRTRAKAAATAAAAE